MRYQFKQGQKLLPQFRQIICLVKVGRDTRTRCITIAEDYSLFEAFLYTVCACSKTEHEPQRRRALERRAFVAHKLLLLQPQQVVVVRLGSLCSSSHTAKNFAFIFDMQALVRLFLPCGSPCVRSTSDCAVLLRSWRTKRSGTAFSRFVLQTPRMPFVACNELAIATKSIASVCPHAERSPWVPFQVGTTVWARRVKQHIL